MAKIVNVSFGFHNINFSINAGCCWLFVDMGVWLRVSVYGYVDSHDKL